MITTINTTNLNIRIIIITSLIFIKKIAFIIYQIKYSINDLFIKH